MIRPAGQPMAVEYSHTGADQFLHRERSFPRAPDRNEARSLLAELATAPCRFSPVLADMPLALYGAGSLGRLARDFLRTVGLEFTFVVDRNAATMAECSDWSGAQLLHPDDVPGSAKGRVRLAVSIVTSPYVPLERSLSDLGFNHIVPFYDLAESFRHLHPLSNGWFASPLSAKDQENTAGVLALWGDDISRAHHLQFLAWRRLREDWAFATADPAPNSRRFFIPEVVSALHGREILLDAGAHHGSVTEAFLKQTQGAFREIIAIEPDPSNRSVLRDRLQSWLPDDQRVTVLDCALAGEEREALFHDGLDYASQLSTTGKMRVTVRPLDALDLAPTFVKLHLEGAELAALKGARETMLACRPIVAATVYHNDDGIWKTALWLMETLPDYRLLFRIHTWCGTGAVIYAIPQDRIARR
jgi:FkbM family methyltransferase